MQGVAGLQVVLGQKFDCICRQLAQHLHELLTHQL